MAQDSLFAVVLAAGRGKRFGATKQLARYDDVPLVTRAVRTAEAVCGRRVLLVTGSDHERVAAACAPLRGFVTVNESFAEGIATSLNAGVASIQHVADAILVMLADQPLVTVDHLSVLAAAWRRSPGIIVTSHYAGTDGPPVIFPRAFFPQLRALQGDRGAKRIIDTNEEHVERVLFEPASVDVDRPQDLEALRS